MTIRYKTWSANEILTAADLISYCEKNGVIQVTNSAELASLDAEVNVAAVTSENKIYHRVGTSWYALLDTQSNAPTASKWATPRTITLGGDLTGNVSIDGSANVTLSAEVADNSHSHSYAATAGNADTVDGQHFAWSDPGTMPTYVWGGFSNGDARLIWTGRFSQPGHGHDYAASSHGHDYLPTAGGTLGGNLTVNGQYIVQPNITTGGSANVYISGSGAFQKVSSTRRYKSAIEPLPNPLAILDVVPVLYHADQSNEDRIGLIAEDVVDALGERAALLDAAGLVENFDDRAVIAALLGVVKDLNERIKTLEGK